MLESLRDLLLLSRGQDAESSGGLLVHLAWGSECCAAMRTNGLRWA